MYRVISRFADLSDFSHIYEVGDSYPRKGLSPSPERIAELMGSKNKVGKPLIEEVEIKKQGKKKVVKKNN